VARGSGMLASQPRLTQSTPAQSSPVQSRYAEVRARSVQNEPSNDWRASARTKDSSAAISTIASTARGWQKSGR
jgi:hypothetical protein